MKSIRSVTKGFMIFSQQERHGSVRPRQHNLWRVRPQPFQPVKIPDRLVKYVHDNVAIIKQNPGTVGESLDAQRIKAMLFEIKLNRLRDGLRLAVRASAAQNKIIGNRCVCPDIQGDYIKGLLLQGRLDAIAQLFSGPGVRLPVILFSWHGCYQLLLSGL